ncbi:MAG: phosphotransferase [Marinosulfonomonas sp.]|nr:phosphotransferase [Marinosulfonomonas sp.]
MSDRTALAARFLGQTVWKNAKRGPLAGDASNRRYERLLDPETGKTAVLMDAPPDKGEDVGPFVQITNHLRAINLSAPQIIAQDTANGFLLIEDLGDTLFARVIPQTPACETMLYEAAVDVLISLQRHAPPSGLTAYDAHAMSKAATLGHNWYGFGLTGHKDTKNAAALAEIMGNLLTPIEGDFKVITLRDYHAENLLWLDDRAGDRRVGLLDYQDAQICHPAYDLASLLEDARRDVPADRAQAMIDRFIRATGVDSAKFRHAYALCGVQRNLRILGIFARLSIHFGKPQYVDLIPRTWAHLLHGLSSPGLQTLRDQILNDLPPPTPENLTILKEKCASIPTL